MTDTTMQGGPSTPDGEGIYQVVKRTLSRRYSAEKRFQAYGLIAIFLALGFLAFLFTDIISNGITAFWQTQVQIEITFDQEIVDPRGDGSEESLLAGDYRTLSRDAFASYFPGVSGRSARREMFDLMSGGAQYSLRETVEDNPDVVGTTQKVWVHMSDDADVFFKGRSTDISTRPVNGIASPTGTEDEIRILSTSNDFNDILQAVKDLLRQDAQDLERDANRLDAVIEAHERALQAGGEAAEEARSQLEIVRADQQELRDDAAALIARADDPAGAERLSNAMPSYFVSINGGFVKITSVSGAEITGDVFIPLESTNDAARDEWEIVVYETPVQSRRLSDQQITWLRTLDQQGVVAQNFNTTLFTAGDSREPEQAGIWGAAVGSFFTLMVTFLLSFPIGVMTAVYLEEFAPKNRITDFIEVNINNLAAVPSIVFGLLGLAVFLNFFGLPRSAPLVGGLVLTLMTLPTIIIASRAALKAVPPSIREAALGMGASRLQAMTHHTLPLAMPGMLTGTIIGMAQALGESAPLLMIGMVAFIVDIPGGPTDPSTVLPVQIYLWADSPERAFIERTSAAIMVLLGFLISMNLLAVLLRKRFERRW